MSKRILLKEAGIIIIISVMVLSTIGVNSIAIFLTPPNNPDTPMGPTTGDVGVAYDYITSTIDPEGDLVFYWWDWDDGTNSGWLGPYNSGENAEASHTWTASGVNCIKVKAKDDNGEESGWSNELCVTISGGSNNPPTVAITYPSNGDTVSGQITITGIASDSDGNNQLQKVEVKIDSGTWKTAIGLTIWSYTWDTTSVSNGGHTIYARSYDGQDYSNIAQVQVTVNNGLPVHNLDTLKDYLTIQEAIDDLDTNDLPDDHDTIYVEAIYTGTIENVEIYKSINLVGENKHTTIIDGGKTKDVLYISADNVEIREFTIQNGEGSVGYSGIYLNANNNIITDNIIKDNELGIYCDCSNGNIITLNDISYNDDGILIANSDNNNISHNTISYNKRPYGSGIFIAASPGVSDGRSDNNIIYDNIIFENEDSGIFLGEGTNNCTVFLNTIRNNKMYGICFFATLSSTIVKNTISENIYCGIAGPNGGVGLTIVENTIELSGIGIYLEKCGNIGIDYIGNTIDNNSIKNCDMGIYSWLSYVNTVTNNTLNSNYQNIWCVGRFNHTFSGNVFDTCPLNDFEANVMLNDISNSVIENNTVESGLDNMGLSIGPATNSIISGNTVKHGKYGLFLAGTTKCNISGNILTDNLYGMHLEGSDKNNISDNIVVNNHFLGLNIIVDSSFNRIFNNYFDNTWNVEAFGPGNINYWNIAKTSGTNIIGGPYLGGNYWSDYYGGDYDGDGLGDDQLPYNCNGKIEKDGDSHPLVHYYKPDLKGSGTLTWVDVPVGKTLTTTIHVENIGEQHSMLDWEIIEYPQDWGVWQFSSMQGFDLKPSDGQSPIDVTLEAPDLKDSEYRGQLKIVNMHNSSDFHIIPIYLKTPKNKLVNILIINFLENHPILYQLFQRFLKL